MKKIVDQLKEIITAIINDISSGQWWITLVERLAVFPDFLRVITTEDPCVLFDCDECPFALLADRCIGKECKKRAKEFVRRASFDPPIEFFKWIRSEWFEEQLFFELHNLFSSSEARTYNWSRYEFKLFSVNTEIFEIEDLGVDESRIWDVLQRLDDTQDYMDEADRPIRLADLAFGLSRDDESGSLILTVRGVWEHE